MNTNAYGYPLGLTHNAFGFPVETCSRCDGSGQYSYNQRDGKRCFKCAGNGYNLAARAVKAWNLYIEAKKEASSIPATEIKVGDMIKMDSYRTVIAIELSENNGGEVRCKMKNGETWVYRTTTMVQTKIDFDPAPFLAMIKPERNKN